MTRLGWRISAAARAGKLPVKLVGGAAVNLHSRSARQAPLKRKYGDLDFVASSKQQASVQKLFESLIAWSPKPSRLFLTKLRSELGEFGVAAEDAALGKFPALLIEVNGRFVSLERLKGETWLRLESGRSR